ncbi:glycosyltransferase family 4 protein [bacterium]|nr:glycosyltransferase family 4 protein [bacterium]
MRKKVYFITPVSFPVGGAATMRKLALAKGLIHHGYDVHIISTMNNDPKSNRELRNFQGVDYHCSAPKDMWGGSKIKKFYHLYYGFYSALLFILKDSKKNSETLITTNEYRFTKCLTIRIIAKMRSAYYYTELNENPMVTYKKKSPISSFVRFSNIKYSLKLYDDVFVMTSKLKELLASNYNIRKNVYVLHNAVDFERFEDLPEIKYIPNTIFYAGSLSFKKDYLDLLLESFKELISYIPDAILKICYFSSDKYLNLFNKKVSELELKDNILMFPDVANSDIPLLMKESQTLIIIRKPNEQTSYGFPTKLVEYLASGRPVIVSSISDIPDFLKHKENAVLLENNSIDEIVEAIRFIFDNPKKADNIGSSGKSICRIKFNNIIESKKIIKQFEYSGSIKHH